MFNRQRPVVFLLVGLMFILAACSSVFSNTEPTAVPTHSDVPLTPLVGTADGADASDPGGNPRDIPECIRDSHGCAVIGPDETIKIGMAGPMTGDFSTFGIDISSAGMLAVEDFGQYLDWSFELIVEDTQGSPDLAIPVAQNWANEPAMVGVAGHIFSGETIETVPIYEEAGLPMMSPSATNPDLTRLGSTVFNRVAFTDVTQARDAAAYLYNELGIRQLAVTHDGEDYGLALAQIVGGAFENLGGEVVMQLLVDPELIELSFALERIARAGAEAIYYGGYDDVGIQVVNTLGDLRASDTNEEDDTLAEEEVDVEGDGGSDQSYDMLFFGCDGTFGAKFRRETGSNGEGVYGTALTPPESDLRQEFDEEYEESFGVAPGVRSPYTWHGYDAVGVLIFAVKQVAIVGDDGWLYVPRGALVEFVRNVENYPGLTGDITCNEVGECSTSGPRFFVIENGEWTPAQ